MGIIQLLDEHLANQIAAGEVVERPSSVVKELVENAIDAGSRTIEVTVEEGGIASIRVVDDGGGMAPDDLRMAFERHATSKIRTSKDLFAIRSLGFRGEALPSIAAVAKVECISSTTDTGLAQRIVIEGGTERCYEESSGPRGTDFRIRELFYNTPARLKYMKTVQTELGHITDFMYRLALTRPDIAFRLEHNGTQLLNTTGGGSLLHAAAAVYGSATAKRMVMFDVTTPDFRIQGCIARPDVTRSNRGGITVAVNGRFVRNFQVAQAVVAGYHTLLPIHRYPLAVVHLTMEPELVDVNVHPAKLEVRFSKEAELTTALQAAVKGALQKETLIPSGMQPQRKEGVFRSGGVQAVQEELRLYKPTSAAAPPPRTLPESGDSRPSGSSASGAEPWSRPAGIPKSGQSSVREPNASAREWTPKETERLLRTMAPVPAKTESEAADAPEPLDQERQNNMQDVHSASPETETNESDSRFPPLYPIGQLMGTYIVAQNENGLYLIDQHAAHERIHYEYFYEKFGNVAAVSQLVFFSHVLEFTSHEAELIKQRLPLLESVGVYLEPFGGNTFKVTSHPAWFPQGDEASLIEEMAQWVLSEKQPDVAKIREASSILCSCKASIKANQAQTNAALETLLARLSACRNPFTCPHGRPIVVSFTKRELEKMFKRVM